MQVDFKDLFTYGWAAVLAFVPRVFQAYRSRMMHIDKKLDENAENNREIKETLAVVVTQMDSLKEDIKMLGLKVDEQQRTMTEIQVELARKKDIDNK